MRVTGTVSIYTLQHLPIDTHHPWVCPECHVNNNDQSSSSCNRSLVEPRCHHAQPKRLTGCQFPCLIRPHTPHVLYTPRVLYAPCPLLHCHCSFQTTVTLNMAKACHKYLYHNNTICTFLNTEIIAAMNWSLW
ncbi:hypothetical protein BsWGS_08368 [Bradybaena similaris]